MKRVIVEFKETGECSIDVNKAIKYWNLLCRLYSSHDTSYILAELTPKGVCKFKVKISKEQAEELISSLKLKCIPNELFKSGKTYLILN